MKLIYIEWLDSCSYTGTWLSEDEAIAWSKETEWVVCQVGWILREDKHSITLISMYEPGSDKHIRMISHIQKIPKTWIRKKVKIKL